jgi:galactonate dehydratase
MKVSSIDTLRIEEFPNLLLVEVKTDNDLIGLGETFYGPASAEAHIHEIIAPYLIGKDPLNIEAHQKYLIGYTGFIGASAERRGASAIDIALWDIWGKATSQPIYSLLGGKVKDKIRIYNTCAGSNYIRKLPTQGTNNFGLDSNEKFEDLNAFLNNPVELAYSLLDSGINAMKIWPFDFAAEKSKGHYISSNDMKVALEPFDKIRKELGDKIDIMAELHSMWNKPQAINICRELENYNPLWIEDPVFMDHLSSLEEVCNNTLAPIAVGETRGGRADYRSLLELNSLSQIIMDISWGGGLSEANKVSSMAEVWHLPIAFHDCTGPVTLTASTHLALANTNCHIQEIVRAFYYGWYADLVTVLPPVENGFIGVPQGNGLGLSINKDVYKRKDTYIKTSKN